MLHRPRSPYYNARMNYDIDNDYDNDEDPFPYDSMVDDLTDEEAIDMLKAEGYSDDEARRMVGMYDPDADEYCFDDHDRDVPDYVDEEDHD